MSTQAVKLRSLPRYTHRASESTKAWPTCRPYHADRNPYVRTDGPITCPSCLAAKS